MRPPSRRPCWPGGPDAPAGRVQEPSAGGGYLSGGYRRRSPADYDPALCLDPRMVIAFIKATQIKEWTRLLAHTREHSAGQRYLIQHSAGNGKSYTFLKIVNDRLQEMIDSHFKLYKQINDNPPFAEFLLDQLFERYMGEMGGRITALAVLSENQIVDKEI